jgi:hypothetical protein
MVVRIFDDREHLAKRRDREAVRHSAAATRTAWALGLGVAACGCAQVV